MDCAPGAPHADLTMILVAMLIGALVGVVFGTAVGAGHINIPAFGFLDAGGDGVTAVLFGALGSAVAGLAAGLVANRGPQPPSRTEGDTAQNASHMSWLTQLPSYGTALAVAFMLYTFYVIAAHGIGAGAISPESARTTWNEKNVTRLGGAEAGSSVRAAWAAATPDWDGTGDPPRAIHVAHDWRAALAATPLIAAPNNATIVPDARDAAVTTDVAATAAEAANIDARLGGASVHILLVAADADPSWALPAGAYAARTATPILFLARTGIPAPTRTALQARGGRAVMLVLAPTDVVSDATMRELARYGHVQRVSGTDPADAAVNFAEYRDEVRDMGWGQTGRGRQRFANHASILVNPHPWEDAIAGAHLARRGKTGPLLYAAPDNLPSVTEAYLWRLRPAYADTPEEGPYSHAWVVGSFASIGYMPQAEADYAQEIEQYMTLGDSAVSGYEALAIAWIILALASAIWVWDNARTRVPEIMPTMRLAWTCFTLLFGVLGAYMYARSYDGRVSVMHGNMGMQMHQGMRQGMRMWQRPMTSRVVSATVMMFGFDMLLMCLAVFAVGYVGYPIIRATNPLYWAGTSMFLMMVLMYVVALIVMLLVFHGPMTMHEKGVPYWTAIRIGFPLMLATMTVESFGMMPAMWWVQCSPIQRDSFG